MFCLFVFSGPIGSILNWSGWAPLSKLNYAAYMFHMIVLTVVLMNGFDSSYVETWTQVCVVLLSVHYPSFNYYSSIHVLKY